MKSINPATNELIREYTAYTSEEVHKILQSVNNDWIKWKKSTFDERAKLIDKAAGILLKERDQCAALITAEMGKLIRESTGEVEKCSLVCRYFAENGAAFLSDETVDTHYRKSFVIFQPLGVLLAVMPWNFPFWQVWRFIAPNLMAGNAVVLKHASSVSGCALKIEEIIRKAGFPSNLFRTLLIPSDQVEAVIRNPIIKGVTLTGSEAAGKRVAAVAGKEVKKCVLELGGSDPFIVFEDADLEKCVQTAVKARCMNVGQVCISAKRFIVIDAVAEPFLNIMTSLMQSMVVGDPLEETTQIGPMARPDLLDEIHSQVIRSIGQGARRVIGGHRLDRTGNYYAPTILTNVTKGMAVYNEETFGPVAAVITVKNEEEALAVANDTNFGLGASVWTKDLNRGERIARMIDSGMVFVNTMTSSHPELPFGGIKGSGFGRELSHYGIKEFVNIKTICLQ